MYGRDFTNMEIYVKGKFQERFVLNEGWPVIGGLSLGLTCNGRFEILLRQQESVCSVLEFYTDIIITM